VPVTAWAAASPTAFGRNVSTDASLGVFRATVGAAIYSVYTFTGHLRKIAKIRFQ